MRVKAILAASMLAVTIGSIWAKTAEEKKLPTIVGEWAVVEFFFHGVEQPRAAREERFFVISEKEFTFVEENKRGRNKFEFGMTRDDTKNPKEIEIERSGSINRGIYKFDQGHLFLSLRSKTGSPFPTSFTPAPNDGTQIYKLTRKK